MTFCVDSNILIWGVKRQGDRVAQAAEFIDWAGANNHRLLAPTVAIHEMMIERVGEDRRGVWLHVLQTQFVIAAFDLRAADLAARLEATHRRPDDANRYKNRFDLQIVATALGHDADAIISYDDDIERIARDQIEVRGFREPDTLPFDEDE